MIILVELTGAIDSAGTTDTYYYSNVAYNHPDAPEEFRERLIEGFIISQGVVGTGSERKTSFSDLILANGDGSLDGLIDTTFDGWSLVVKAIPDISTSYSSATVLFTGSPGQAHVEGDRVTIPIKERLTELDQPALLNHYAGDNSLPNGLEGTADDIKDQPKPKPFGNPFNVEPAQVNTSRKIYQFYDGSDADVTGVFDGGVALTQGSDYTDQTDMETNAPAAGNFRVWPGGGYFRITTGPFFTLTCDVLVGAAGSDRTLAQGLKNLAIRSPTIDASDVNSTDVTELDATEANPVQWWSRDETSIREAMNKLIEGVPAYYGFDRIGQLRMGLWTEPVADSAGPNIIFRRIDQRYGDTLATGEYNIISLIPEPPEEPPAFEATVKHTRNYTVQANLDTNITNARRAIVEEEWRRSKVDNSGIQPRWPTAQSLAFDSSLADATGGDAAASRIITNYGVERRRWTLVAHIGNLSDLPEIGEVAQVFHPRFGLSSGKLFRIEAIEFDTSKLEQTLLLWG